jgi:hypothetical protein
MAASTSTNERSGARYAWFYMLNVNGAIMDILSVGEH